MSAGLAAATAVSCCVCLPAFGLTPLREFQSLRQDFFDASLKHAPEWGTGLGVKGYDDKLSDPSMDESREYIAVLESLEERLQGLEPYLSQIDPQDRIDFGVIRSSLHGQLHSMRDREDYLTDVRAILIPYNTIATQILQSGGGNPSINEWEKIVGRVSRIPVYLQRAKETLREGLKRGEAPDRRLTEQQGIKSAAEVVAYFNGEFIDEARKSLTSTGILESDARIARLEARARAASAAYRDISAFVESEVLPRTKTSYALGENEYAWQLHHVLGIKESPRRLQASGQEAADRIEKRMRDLARQIDSKKDLAEVMSDLQSDHPANDKELLEAFNRATVRAKTFVDQGGLFSLPPSYQVKIVPTPAPLRSSVNTAAYYGAPPLDTSKEGAFMVTPSEGDIQQLKNFNDYSLVSTAVHEAFPGHGLQYYVFGENRATISPVRYLSSGFSSALNVEGWACMPRS